MLSPDDFVELLRKVATDPGLAQRFSTLATAQDAALLADQLGYTVTAEELTGATGATTGEISDAELAGAAGGTGVEYRSLLEPRSSCRLWG